VKWELVREIEILGENLPQYHFVHQKSHMTWPGSGLGLDWTQNTKRAILHEHFFRVPHNNRKHVMFLEKCNWKSCYSRQRKFAQGNMHHCIYIKLAPWTQNNVTSQTDSYFALLPLEVRTGYGLSDRGVGVRVPVRARFFSSLPHSDRFWGPASLLSNGYRGLFPRG
jgi:hypothetical protein